MAVTVGVLMRIAIVSSALVLGELPSYVEAGTAQNFSSSTGRAQGDRLSEKRANMRPACRGVGLPCSSAGECCEPWFCGIDRSGSVPKRCR